MLKSAKNVFWEALLVTAVIFFFGILLGIAFENNRLDKIDDYYTASEISMMDILALNDIMQMENISCDNLIHANIDFADRIYEEARLLERYEGAGKISDDFKLAHKKYDLMRTFLWANTITSDKCIGFNSVVYLYEYETEDLGQKAVQNVWSKILTDLKEEVGGQILLIPIAVDSNLASLNALTRDFNLSGYPVVIINNKQVITELSKVDDLKKYLE